MNSKTAILSVRIIGDASRAIAAFGATETAAEKFSNGIKRASAIAVIAILAIISAALGLGQVASNLQQSQGAVDAVFGVYSEQVHTFARDAAQQTGLAEVEYSTMAAIIGAQLTNMGVGTDQLADQTNNLIKIGADLAAQYGGSTSDAVQALSSLLRGERDPIERYGVSIKQADIDARKAALGLTELTGEADKAADLQATLAILIDQTASASGAFTRELDTAANQQQRANAEWQNAKAALGEELLPYMAEGARIAADLAHWVGENEEIARNVAVAVVVLAGALIALQGALTVATVAQTVFDIALSANPIGAVIALILVILALLGALIYLLVTYWEQFEDAGVQAAIALISAYNGVVGVIEAVINAILQAIYWMQQFDIIGNAVRGAAGQANFTAPATVTLPRATVTGATTTINNTYNVNGAIDAQGTAKAISKVQRTDARSVGKGGVRG